MSFILHRSSYIFHQPSAIIHLTYYIYYVPIEARTSSYKTAKWLSGMPSSAYKLLSLNFLQKGYNLITKFIWHQVIAIA